MRSAECGVPLIRCANNGISLVTDERGRVLDSLPLGRAGLVAADLKPGTGGTLFVRLGNTPLVIFLLGWTLFILMLPVERSHAHTS
jgi:apolipoprotein N-acyltransferase